MPYGWDAFEWRGDPDLENYYCWACALAWAWPPMTFTLKKPMSS